MTGSSDRTSRRAVLRAGAWGAVLAPFASVATVATAESASATGYGAAVTRPGLYNRARFKPLVRKRFTLTDGRHSWQVTLVKVRNLPGAVRGDSRKFALTFSAAKSGPPQGTYTLKRTNFRPTTLFVVPSDARRRTYEVVINRK